jgi:hypothetical protein
MPYDMTIIATVTASDEIAEIWWLVTWAGLIVPTILGLVTLVLTAVSRRNSVLAMRIAAIGGLISLVPILFALHVYRIDFVGVGGDGTPASPPLLSVMALPLMPLIVCLVAGSTAYVRRRNPTTEP